MWRNVGGMGSWYPPPPPWKGEKNVLVRRCRFYFFVRPCTIYQNTFFFPPKPSDLSLRGFIAFTHKLPARPPPPPAFPPPPTPLALDQNQAPTSFKTPLPPHQLFDLQDSLDKNGYVSLHSCQIWSRRGPTPEWVGWTVTGPSSAEGHLPWPGVLLVGELAQVPHYPER